MYEDEIGGTCSMFGEVRSAYELSTGASERTRPLGRTKLT
jgi:hypothetical protein